MHIICPSLRRVAGVWVADDGVREGFTRKREEQLKEKLNEFLNIFNFADQVLISTMLWEDAKPYKFLPGCFTLHQITSLKANPYHVYQCMWDIEICLMLEVSRKHYDRQTIRFNIYLENWKRKKKNRQVKFWKYQQL